MSAFILASLLAVATPLPAAAQEVHAFNISASDPASAIRTFGVQAGIQILASADDLKGKKFNPVSGDISTEDGLNSLLAGTGLAHRYVGDRAVALVDNRVAAENPNDENPTYNKEGKKNSSGDFRVAQVDQGQSSNASSVANQTSNPHENSSGSSNGLSEIVVTAQKRNERLQDVPVPVTAISADTLLDSNQVSIEDYYTRVPGLSVTPTGFGGPQVTIRGITTGGFANPTVGVVVDDVPYGSSTNIGGLGSIVPDIDPSDLARIEVLRGPQGTLYGASAMGGLLKFVTIDPSTDGVSGHVQAGTSSSYNGAEMGYSFRGTVNVPLSDTIAVLASGFTRRDPGYVDNIETGQEGVNSLRVDGGRLSALWRPSQDFSLKLSAMLQDATADGSSDIDPDLANLQQSKLINTGGYNKRVEVYTATLTAKLAGIDITSVSGYNLNKFSFSSDYSPFFGPYAQTFGVSGAPLLEQNKTDKFTQEIRLSSSIGQRFDWLFGAFYTNENSLLSQQIPAVNSTTGETVGSILGQHTPSTYSEYAGFADLTYRITDQFDVQVGGRESEIKQTQSSSVTTGLLAGPAVPEIETKANAFTYLITPRFRLTPDVMLYARLASGYRAGGPNPNVILLSLPHSFQPDKTLDYEIGAKSDFWNHRLTLDASVYYIDWKDIQLQVQTSDGFLYYTNGGQAKSQGVELSTEARPVEGLTLAAWVAWSDAALTQALPPSSVAAGAYGLSGDRLPDSSRFSGSVSLDEDFHISGEVKGFVGGAVSYQSNRLGNFVGSPPAERYIFPAYARTDLRAGVKYESWTINVFANNIADKRGVLTNDVTPNSFLYITPRTIGLNVSKKF